MKKSQEAIFHLFEMPHDRVSCRSVAFYVQQVQVETEWLNWEIFF